MLFKFVCLFVFPCTHWYCYFSCKVQKMWSGQAFKLKYLVKPIDIVGEIKQKNPKPNRLALRFNPYMRSNNKLKNSYQIDKRYVLFDLFYFSQITLCWVKSIHPCWEQPEDQAPTVFRNITILKCKEVDISKCWKDNLSKRRTFLDISIPELLRLRATFPEGCLEQSLGVKGWMRLRAWYCLKKKKKY